VISCEDVDLMAILEGRTVGEKDQRHFESCPDCQAELKHLNALLNQLTPYFTRATNEICPRQEKITSYVLEREAPLPSGLAIHVETCPTCAQSLLLIQDFERGFESASSNEPLPEKLQSKISSYRRRQTAARTRKALEGLVDKGRRGSEWIAETVERSLSGRVPGAAPAAPEDLTRAKDEPLKSEPKEQDKKDVPDPSKKGEQD
jgi:hypothetical protein